jgi:alcohol dehydrogenase (NADP+)
MDKIDITKVPYKTLPGGDRIPTIGLGTFSSDNYSAEQTARAVKTAILRGYRHIDCGSVYQNEKEIGKVLEELINEERVKRDELWITSKVWNDMHDKVEESCRQSLSDLRLDYLDLYLVHWPFPNHHPPGCDVESRMPDAKPYIHEYFMNTWRQMEGLVNKGLVRNIGTSNMTIPKLKLLLHDCEIRPVANELELHPHFQQPGLFDFLVQNNILAIGYSPLGSPNRPERDRTENDTVDIEDPVIVKIAENHGIHPALVCIKWAIQRGQIPIPFSVNEDKLASNLKAATEDPLTQEEMNEIAGIDKNCRLIKGQVFLWQEARGWEDLWDLDGNIAK